MVLKKVGVVGTASAADVLDGETFTSETEGGEATGTMPNRGIGDIDGPHDELNGAGYYSRIDNNILDRGTIGNLSPGEYGSSGYYDSGSVAGGTTTTFTFGGWEKILNRYFAYPGDFVSWDVVDAEEFRPGMKCYQNSGAFGTVNLSFDVKNASGTVLGSFGGTVNYETNLLGSYINISNESKVTVELASVTGGDGCWIRGIFGKFQHTVDVV